MLQETKAGMVKKNNSIMFVIGKISLFGNMPRFHLTTTQAWRDSEKYVNGSVAYFIAPCHPQQDSRHSNHCFCTLCVFNMDLLFCDNKKKKRGRGRGWAYRVFFSLFLFFSSVNNWTKVRESEDTRREKAAENTGDCQAACDKTFTRELSACHKALLFWIPKGFEFPNKLFGRQICALSNDSGLQHRSHLWTPLAGGSMKEI